MFAATPAAGFPTIADGDQHGQLIADHAAAHEKWLDTLFRLDEIESAYNASREPIKVPVSTGHVLEEAAFSDIADCREQVSGFYASAHLHIRTIARIAPGIAEEYAAALAAAEQANLALVDRLFAAEKASRAAMGLTAAEYAELEANDAEESAMMALLAHPVKSLKEAQRKASYLAASRYRDLLGQETAAFLQSFMESDNG